MGSDSRQPARLNTKNIGMVTLLERHAMNTTKIVVQLVAMNTTCTGMDLGFAEGRG